MNKRFLFVLGLLLVGSVMIVRAQTSQPRPLYALPGANVRVFTSGSMALLDSGRTLVTANMLNDTISVVQLQQETVAEIAVGNDPRTVMLTPDNTRVLVVNRQDGSLSVVNLADQTVLASHPIGVLPYAVVTDNDTTAFVSVQGESLVLRLDITDGRILNRIPVPDNPAGLALWGDFLYVTHLWSGELSLIYLPQMEVVRTIATGRDTGLSQSLAIDPANGTAYLPQTRSNAQNPALTFHTVVFPVVNVIDLSNMSLQRQARVTLDTADRPVNMPFASALDGPRRWLYVVNAGSDDLSVIDLNSGLARGHVKVGANPRSVILSRDNSLAYIHNMIDGTLTIIETRALRVADVIPISDLSIPIDIFIGAQLFHSSSDPRMSRDGWVSCASCHFDGLSDGRVWQGISGGRNTPGLFGLDSLSSFTWTGDWDELADVEWKIRRLHAGDGLIADMFNDPAGDPNVGLSLDLDALTTYLAMLESPAAPLPDAPVLVERGADIFERLKCGGCHTGVAGTDGQRHDVGTGGAFVTPTINWVWLSAPYFHDGRAETLDDVFALPGVHQLIRETPAEDITALVAYLRSLPAR